MRITLLLFITTYIYSCSSNSDNEKISYYPNSKKIHQKYQVVKGKKNGLYQEFFKDGKLKVKMNYVNDTLNDTSFFYFKNGQLINVQIHKMGQRNGLWRNYTKNGVLLSEFSYKDDKLNGPMHSYTYKTGKTLLNLNYDDNLLDGRQEEFHQNGKPKSVRYFERGKEGIGTEEWTLYGEKVDNDFKINVREDNKVAFTGFLKYYISLENGSNDDEIYLLADDDDPKSKFIRTVKFIEKEGNNFIYEIPVTPGNVIFEKLNFAAIRKTQRGNKFIKRFTINATSSNY